MDIFEDHMPFSIWIPVFTGKQMGFVDVNERAESRLWKATVPILKRKPVKVVASSHEEKEVITKSGRVLKERFPNKKGSNSEDEDSEDEDSEDEDPDDSEDEDNSDDSDDLDPRVQQAYAREQAKQLRDERRRHVAENKQDKSGDYDLDPNPQETFVGEEKRKKFVDQRKQKDISESKQKKSTERQLVDFLPKDGRGRKSNDYKTYLRDTVKYLNNPEEFGISTNDQFASLLKRAGRVQTGDIFIDVKSILSQQDGGNYFVSKY